MKICIAHSLKPRSPTYPTCDAIFWVCTNLWHLGRPFNILLLLQNIDQLSPMGFHTISQSSFTFFIFFFNHLELPFKTTIIDPWHTCRKGDDPNTQTPSPMLLLLFWALLMVVFGCHQWQDQASRWNFKSVVNQLFLPKPTILPFGLQWKSDLTSLPRKEAISWRLEKLLRIYTEISLPFFNYWNSVLKIDYQNLLLKIDYYNLLFIFSIKILIIRWKLPIRISRL